MTASIVGTIKSQQGEAVAGVSLKLMHEPTGSAFAKTSDADGHYEFLSVKVGGPYTLSVINDASPPNESRNINLKIDEKFVQNFIV
jgi:Carboxypeptidase regulatory-like domain